MSPRTPKHLRLPLTVGVAAFGALVVGTATASAQPWPLEPASNNARLISELFWLTLVLAAVVFLMVESLIIYSSLRFRRRSPLPGVEPPQVHGNGRLEIMWAIVPALILIGLFGVSVRTLNALGDVPEGAYLVQVEAFQFAFEFQYPEGTAADQEPYRILNEARIPLGRPVVFEMASRDVIHSFWVPGLYGKLDVFPGRVNRMWFTPEEPGLYRGVCAELCGQGHAAMLFSVEVLPQAEFDQWLASARSGAAEDAAAGPSTERGAELFTAKGCNTCHTLAAVPGATGTIGPSLNNIGTTAAQRRPGLDAEAYIRQSIAEPNAFIAPGFPPVMPEIPMTEQELDSLVAFLAAQR